MGRACSPMGRLIVSGGEPKFRQTTSGTHGSAHRADCLPRGKPPASMTRDNFAVSKFPWWGLTRRLRRGKRVYSPMGHSIALGGDPKGVQGGERKATLLASMGNNFAVSKSPRWGMTRRLRRG